MPRVPLESTEHFTWPGNINHWPTQKLVKPITAVRTLIGAIEDAADNPPPVKVWDISANGYGMILVMEEENLNLANAYRFLRYSYIPVEKKVPPIFDRNKRYPQEILDHVPIRSLTQHEEDPF